MAALTKNHGVRFIDAGEDARTVVVPDFSTIGLIGHAEDADETLFPLNKNVQIFGDEVEKIEKLGLLGDLPPAIDAILAEGINPSVRSSATRLPAPASGASSTRRARPASSLASWSHPATPEPS